MEQGDLHEETRNVLCRCVLNVATVAATGARETQPGLCSRVTDKPLERVQNVKLHLEESRRLVGILTQLDKILDGRRALLGVLELGSNPERSAPNKLVVLYIDDAAGDVAVDNVER